MAEKDVQWVRKLKPLEIFYEVGQRYGIIMTAYNVTLNSRCHISEDDVRTTLHFLYRKIPSLRLRILEKNEDMWFAEVPEEVVDFEFCNEASVNEIMQVVSHTPYDSTKGPLWRARYIQQNCEYYNSTLESCSDFPIQSHFIFGSHHGTTDAYSNLKIIECFLKTLNEVTGKHAVSEDQVGVFSSGAQSDLFLDERIKELEQDQEHFDQVKKEIQNNMFNVNTYWKDAFGYNDQIENTTCHLESALDSETTARFIETLKKHSVSINSVFCATMNLTLLEMMKSRGLTNHSFDIGSLHAVNMRQFWTNENLVHFGLQIGIMRVYIKTKRDASSNFWDYVKEVHNMIQEKVETKWPLNEAIVQGLIFDSGISSLENLFTAQHTPHTLLYTASSLGNVDRVVNSEGDFVKWTALSRTISMHLLATPFGFNFQKFRNRMSYSIEYATRYVDKNLAELILDSFSSRLKAVIQDRVGL